MDCEHRTLAVVLLAVAVAFEGLCYAGYMVNQIDFAPRSVQGVGECGGDKM